MDRGRGRPSRSRSHSRSRSRGRDRSRDRPTGARLADKRVYISNIPYDSRWQDIKDLFRQEVGEVAFVELFSDESDKPRGCGIIEFESAVSAKKAIEKMHRHELGGRKIVVKEDYDVERDKSGRIVTGSNRSGGGGGGGGGRERSRERENRDRGDWDRRNDNSPLPGNAGGGGKFGNTYGLSQQFLDSLGIDGPLISKVFISNLDFRVDDKKLKEVFRLAGRVLFVDINKDKDGKSRGHGTIEFEHPVEAVQAISMFNDQQLYERRMHVKMDRLSDPIADLAKNRLPDGLKSIGMGLGANGQPLVDVSRNLPSFNASGNSTNLIGGAGLGSLNNPLAMNMNMSNLGMSQLASAMINPQTIDLGGGVGLSNAASVSGQAASNVFNVASGMGPLATLNTPNQFTGGPSGLSMNTLVGTPSNAVNVSALMGNPGSGGGSQGNAQQSFQNSGGSGNQGPGNTNFREIDYGYSASYNTSNVNTNVFQRDRQQFGGSGGGGGGGGGQITNTVIVSNLPPSCTWQTLKAKFREYGEIVFAEKRDNNTGIVRFATERDAERAVKVFHQSRVDGRIVDVRFL